VTLTDIKAEPLGVWDVSHIAKWQSWMAEANDWAQRHIQDANATYRVEFFLVDAPFAVVWRYERNEHGRRYRDEVTSEPARAEPVVQMLGELPPAHLLERKV
jgi:hypothetical protein